MSSEKGIHVDDAPYYNLLGVHMKIVLSSKQTNGQFSMIEGVVPPGGDGGLHEHDREDETMWLVEGELEVTIGDETFMLKAGESYFAPKKVPQRLRNVGDVPARGLVVTMPGGFDEAIAQAAKPSGPEPMPFVPPTIEELTRIAEVLTAHGITMLEPPPLSPA